MHLSIIMPAYNEEKRLPPSLERVFAFLSAQDYEAEVVVVDNGSDDRTLEVVSSLCDRYQGLRVLHESRRGKGLAVRRGMLEARGEFRLLCDADLEISIEQAPKFLPPALTDFDVAIGSRLLPGSVVTRSTCRTCMSWVFNALTRLLVLPGIRDTLCGFKCFRAPAAEDIFRRQSVTGFAFDVELLHIARRRNWRIAEVPITCTAVSKVRPSLLQGVPMAALDLLTIRSNGRKGLYDD